MAECPPYKKRKINHCIAFKMLVISKLIMDIVLLFLKFDLIKKIKIYLQEKLDTIIHGSSNTVPKKFNTVRAIAKIFPLVLRF
jgi:hypothetical protein